MARFDWACDVGATSREFVATASLPPPLEFGDGYQQLQEQGLNPVREIWDVQISGTDEDVAAEIDAMMRSHFKRVPFEWIPPGELVYRKWIVTSVRKQLANNRLEWDFSLKFEEWFAP